MRVPPYGKQFLSGLPRTGIQVAFGPNAWKFANLQPFIVMVLPPGESPWDYRWPSHVSGALLHEQGQYDDDSLVNVASALLSAGNPFVAARREALLDTDPMVWFYPEASDAA